MNEPSVREASRWNERPRGGWRLLWSASSLALAPQRIVLAFLLVSALMGVGSIFDAIAGDVEDLGHGVFETLSASVTRGVGETAMGLATLDLPRLSSGFYNGFVFVPAELVRASPWRCALLVAVLLPVWTLGGGAIARSASVEAARGRTLGVAECLGYALSRRWSLLGSYVLPAFLIALGCGLLWLFGVVLLSIPVVNIVGSALYGLALVIGLVTAMVALGLSVGFPLLVPAVAADSADTTDAFQRTYSYLVDRPFSLLIWAIAMLAQGAAGVLITAILVTVAMNWTAGLTGAGADGLASDVRLFTPLVERDGLDGTFAVASGVIGVWERAALGVIGAHALSIFFCASTVIYLRVRAVCDGQAIEDIWPRVTAVESVQRGEIKAIADTHHA